MRVYNPVPPDAPVRYPRRIPKRAVPSYIGKADQVLNLLMYKGAGNVARDYSGEKNHGDINGPTWTDEHLASWGLEFDGVDDYVEVSNDPTLDGMDQISIIAWINLNTTSGRQQIITMDDDTTARCYIFDQQDGYVEWSVFDSAGNERKYESDDAVLSAGSNYCVGVRFRTSDDAMGIFVDGSEVAGSVTKTEAIDHVNSGDTPVTLGYRDYSGNYDYLDGTIVWGLIYTRYCSASFMKAFYDKTKFVF